MWRARGLQGWKLGNRTARCNTADLADRGLSEPQRPTDPTVIFKGTLLCVGIGNDVARPAVVMRPITLEAGPVNQSAPSGPVTIPESPSKGWSASENWVMAPVAVMRPIGRDV